MKIEAKKETIVEVVTIEKPVEVVTITMPIESARELKYLMGSIAGTPEGTFRESTSDPIYFALETILPRSSVWDLTNKQLEKRFKGVSSYLLQYSTCDE